MRRLLCLRLPHWPIQRLRAERPDLRGEPLVLLRPDPRRGPCVVDCCRRARSAGVRAGMTLTDAQALLPPVVARPHDPDADRVGLGRLAAECEQFSPRVGWETVGSKKGTGTVTDLTRSNTGRAGKVPVPFFEHLFLDVTGLGHLFGGEQSLAGEVLAACRERMYAGRAAVADTLGAAWALAGTGNPVAVVPTGQVLPALWPLPVESLRLPDETGVLLGRLGVATVGDLLALPRAGLAARFGPPLLQRLDQAIGTAPEMLVPHRPPPVFEAAEELDDPTDRRADLDWVLDRLIQRVTTQLQSHGRGAVHVRGELRSGSEVVGTIDVALYRPTDLAKPVRELVRLHCDRLALPGPVDRIRLWADQTIPLRPRQIRLFVDPAEAVAEPLAELLERLGSRLGPAAVVRPAAYADPLPERAVRWGQFAVRSSQLKAEPSIVPAANCEPRTANHAAGRSGCSTHRSEST